MQECHRNPYAPHKIRAAFSEILGIAKMKDKFIDAFMAHGDAYHGTYNKYKDEELEAEYTQYMAHLSVTEDPRLPGMETGLEDALKRIDDLEKRNEALEDENIERILEELFRRHPNVKKAAEKNGN